MLLKSNIDQEEDSILGLSTVMVAKKVKELIKKDDQTIADIKGARLEMLKSHYKNYVDDAKEYEFNEAYLLRLSRNYIKDMYLLKIRGVFHHLNAKVDFINVNFLYIKRIIIKNRIEDTQLRVESYQCAFNLTKPTFYMTGIDHKIPYTPIRTDNGVVYLNKHNVKSLMLREEVHKLCDGTLMKARKNLQRMLDENILGHGNKNMKVRGWTMKDIKRSKAIMEKIKKTFKHRANKKARRVCWTKPKTIDLRSFVRPE
nr:hypothetical protein [Tanacetum cinerariifolium]